MPRIRTSDNEPLDFCLTHFPQTERDAYKVYGTRGGQAGGGNAFVYDDEHPPYETTDYRCQVCGEPLTAHDDESEATRAAYESRLDAELEQDVPVTESDANHPVEDFDEPALDCYCGHPRAQHLTSKIPDGSGGRIENDDQKCDHWETCGCEGFSDDDWDDAREHGMHEPLPRERIDFERYR